MAVRTVCKTRRAICIQGALVTTGPHRGTLEQAQGCIATQQSKLRATSRHGSASPGPHRDAVARNSKRPRDYRGLACNGGPSGTRTLDLGIKSPLLYQLS